MCCRGGSGRRFSSIGAFLFQHEVTLIDFNRSTQPPDRSGRNLQPGQCTPADFPLSSFDPTQIQRGRVIELLPGESYEVISLDPEVRNRNYIAYLKNPNTYWSFHVYYTSYRY